MLELRKTELAGVLLIEPDPLQDMRGLFVKIFNEEEFREQGIDFIVKECFYSVSQKNVIRGMHFQIPPHAHAKLVYVPFGVVSDVVLDIRAGSPTFGQSMCVALSAENRQVLYIPAGFAHGFSVESEQAMVMYQVSSVHAPEYDRGIRWDSFGHAWGNAKPIVSEKDSALPEWEMFQTPFQYRS